MSETPVVPFPPEALSLVEVWAESAGRVLGQIAGGAALPVEVLQAAAADAEPAADTDLWLRAACSGGVSGELSLRLPRSIALPMAQLFMADPPDPAAEFKPEYRDALEELFRQVAGHVATALKARWGEVQIRLEAATPPAWPAAATAWLRTAAGAGCALRAEVLLNAALVAGLRPAATEVPAAATAGTLPAAPAPLPVHLPPEVKLDLLLDVELAAMLRFGSRRMLLRDILELNAGAVVELDRQLTDPVDLLLDGRLIARGEVVVVDGNYGLRVTEMVASEPALG